VLAITNLKLNDALNPQKLLDIAQDSLVTLIRPGGYANTKASYIKYFVQFLSNHYGLDIALMLKEEINLLRMQLLSIKGIGDFTADNILLYAADREKLPINPRMRKVFYEHDLINEVDSYDTVQNRMESVIPFNLWQIREFDALLYRTASEHCRAVPSCEKCPLQPVIPERGPRSLRA
jgi:endonuclease III related protein